MYEERLGTDWESLTDEEAIDRAFALGVASVFGYENDEEFDRLRGALEKAYDRSIVDLAYKEGQQKARELRGETPDDDVWDRLVEDGPTRSGSGRIHPRAERAPTVARPSVIDRAGLLDGGAKLGALRIPAFLRRSDEREGEE